MFSCSCDSETASDILEFSNFMSVDRKFNQLCGQVKHFNKSNFNALLYYHLLNDSIYQFAHHYRYETWLSDLMVNFFASVWGEQSKKDWMQCH